MKLKTALGLLAPLVITLILSTSAGSMDDPGFMINRMVICKDIAQREPVTIAETFSADTEKVYSFLEATSIERDTIINFVWYFESNEVARVSLPLVKGRRWRTYSSKKIGAMKGDWKVELQDATGIILHSITFRVQ